MKSESVRFSPSDGTHCFKKNNTSSVIFRLRKASGCTLSFFGGDFVYFFETDKPYFTATPFSWERERRQFRERPDIGTAGALPGASPAPLLTAAMAMAALSITGVSGWRFAVGRGRESGGRDVIASLPDAEL